MPWSTRIGRQYVQQKTIITLSPEWQAALRTETYNSVLTYRYPPTAKRETPDETRRPTALLSTRHPKWEDADNTYMNQSII